MTIIEDFKKSIVEMLTPENTEEIKPSLFLQTREKGYRIINPAAWNGQIRWKEQLKTVFSLRTFISLGIILFIVYAYLHDTEGLRQFQEKIAHNPAGFCREFDELRVNGICNDFLQKNGICDLNGTTYPVLNLNGTIIRSP